ncbi:MAG TPA: SCO family protein [Candidatus Krumholzibacteria bacterium]|nr:SCO family protein [Candidatus Krumholzibacteria bacterium]HRX51896.1 SCO family protein [Candidatus Krumholzibacteria bacterium]
MIRTGARRLGALLLLSALLAAPAAAERQEQAPAGLEAAGITERLDAQVPLDLEFTAEDSTTVRLGDLFTGDRPVILQLGYYACPMLCGLVLNGLVVGMEDLAWTPGGEFEIVSVSIDPREGPRLARLKKDTYLKQYGRPEAEAGWRFLTGREENIRALADSVGFGYVFNVERQEWMHAAALFVLTPDGRVSRYLYGVEFDARTLRLSLVEASEGKIGSSMDRFLLYCFHYDSSVGRYGPAARRLMSMAGAVTVAALGLFLIRLWRRDRRGKSRP